MNLKKELDFISENSVECLPFFSNYNVFESDTDFLDYCKNDVKNTVKVYKLFRRKRRFEKVKKLLKKVFKKFLIVGLLFILFFILNRIAEAERGYKAIGGEGLVFVLPLFVVTIRDLIHEFIDNRKK